MLSEKRLLDALEGFKMRLISDNPRIEKTAPSCKYARIVPF